MYDAASVIRICNVHDSGQLKCGVHETLLGADKGGYGVVSPTREEFIYPKYDVSSLIVLHIYIYIYIVLNEPTHDTFFDIHQI